MVFHLVVVGDGDGGGAFGHALRNDGALAEESADDILRDEGASGAESKRNGKRAIDRLGRNDGDDETFALRDFVVRNSEGDFGVVVQN